jgi:hypothetical protein
MREGKGKDNGKGNGGRRTKRDQRMLIDVKISGIPGQRETTDVLSGL